MKYLGEETKLLSKTDDDFDYISFTRCLQSALMMVFCSFFVAVGHVSGFLGISAERTLAVLEQPKVRRQPVNSMRLRISALSQTSIESILRELEDVSSNVVKKKVIDDEVIGQLNDEQVEWHSMISTNLLSSHDAWSSLRCSDIRMCCDGCHLLLSAMRTNDDSDQPVHSFMLFTHDLSSLPLRRSPSSFRCNMVFGGVSCR